MVFVEFRLVDFATEFSEHAQVDACCKITHELTAQYDLKYGIDFWFEEAKHDWTGQRLLKFGFRDEKQAFLAKLRGIVQP